jgi:hypothetical protein
MQIPLPLAIALLAISMPATAKDKNILPGELVLSGDFLVDVQIEGRPFKLQVRPEGAVAPMLNPEAAIALQLKPGMFGFYSAVGSEKVSGASAVHKIDYGDGEQKQRIFWASRASSTVADGTISPASLPYKRVTFELAAPVAGEILHRLPLDNFGFLGRYGVGTTEKAGDEKIQFRFSLVRDETLVSAPTGNWLAENRGGKLSGASKSTLIYYGIQRPTRPMVLQQPLTVGDFVVSAVDVRVSDYGDATGIAEQDSVAADNEEIIVTGKRDKDVDLLVVAGRSFLTGCSSLTYDFDKREIRLSCAVRTAQAPN